MTGQRKKTTSELATLYALFLTQQSDELRLRCAAVCHDRARSLGRLHKQGVVTIADLLERSASLSPNLKRFAIELILLLRIRQAIPVLLELMSERDLRVSCASTIYFLNPGKKVNQRFLEIGKRELSSSDPDRFWLEAVIHGLGSPKDRAGVELLVTIFERNDLPGWLRGDAADKLGCCGYIDDRRGKLFRRCRATALSGLGDESFEVQFWSMYLIGSLCCHGHRRRHSTSRDFSAAMPILRRIAANDQRLAPGYWWPMSAEAEDVMKCIQIGRWPDPDAADRWIGNAEPRSLDTRLTPAALASPLAGKCLAECVRSSHSNRGNDRVTARSCGRGFCILAVALGWFDLGS